MSAKSTAFEKDMERLREIAEKLSDGALALEEMMKLYEEGVKLCDKCRKALDGYEARLITIERRNGDAADE